MKYPLRKSAVLIAALLVAGAGFAGQSLAAGSDDQAEPKACQYPAEVLDLTNWRMTLPIGEEDNPTDIDQPELATAVEDPWFVPLEDCSGVRFRAAVNGVTTENSKNPRSELREMNGEEEAAWSSSEGKHTMVVNEAFTAVPNDKPHVVGAQIHGGDDDFAVFRLEDKELWITDKDEPHGTLADESYTLGDKFEAKFVVENGVTEVYYNGTLVTSYEEDYDGAYFKAGGYTQANCESPSDPCDETNYGEVVIYDVTVTHE